VDFSSRTSFPVAVRTIRAAGAKALRQARRRAGLHPPDGRAARLRRAGTEIPFCPGAPRARDPRRDRTAEECEGALLARLPRALRHRHAPRRAEFFRGELEQYLLYARDAGIDVFSVRGSYAGAIGIPQFMPGSYRRYAVDFDGDGAIDLRASPADAIGSVANFLVKHGWRRGERVHLPARVTGDAHRELVDAGIEPKTNLSEMKRYGVETRTDLALETPLALIELESPGAATEYRLGLRNFYVLTRYNRSVLYASAVYDLAQEIKAKH